MTDAVDRLNRMVSLIAELTRRRRDDLPAATLDELAGRFGCSVSDVQGDLRRLSVVADAADAEWLLSLSLLLEGDRVEGGSSGPFQRPMRLTPDEALVFRLSVGLDDGEVPEGFDAWLPGPATETPIEPYRRAAGVEALTDLLLHAVDGRRRVSIAYAAPGAVEPDERVIQPHQVVVHRGRSYAIAWCETRADWRRFRLDRVVGAEIVDRHFDLREDCPYDRVIDEGADADRVLVRFDPSIARWIDEWAREAVRGDDGSVTYAYEVSSVDWLVRRVLQYGAEAEVMEPPSYREAMREAVTDPR